MAKRKKKEKRDEIARTARDLLRSVNRGYRVVLADPPWAYRNFSGDQASKKYGSANAHYPTDLSVSEIASLPVEEIIADDAVLFLWATMPNLPEAFAVMRGWGFVYKTAAFVWVKLRGSDPLGTPIDGWYQHGDRLIHSLYSGLGNYTNSNAEICLFGRRGKPERKRKDVKQIIVSPLRGHSRKPDEQYARIEGLYDGPYLELFATRRMGGWDAWGNAIPIDFSVAAEGEMEVPSIEIARRIGMPLGWDVVETDCETRELRSNSSGIEERRSENEREAEQDRDEAGGEDARAEEGAEAGTDEVEEEVRPRRRSSSRGSTAKEGRRAGRTREGDRRGKRSRK